MYLIDSNIFLEILMQQENSEECKELLGKIAEGEIRGYVSNFTVHGVERMLTEDPDTLQKFLKNVNTLVNLKVVETNVEEERQIVELAKSTDLDFDDALQYTVAQRENMEAIISFDTDFNETGLKRLEPGDLLK